MALESSPENPQPLRTIAQAVRGWIDRLGAVWVTGQLIEVNRRYGTVFLVLRDEHAEVSVNVSLSTTVFDQAGPITEGGTVVAHVKPQYWMKSGRLTFECKELRPTGEGRLLAQLEHRKRLLQAEGLFDAARKQRLPFLPGRIGLITGAGSAAERDVLANVQHRWPAARFEVAHVSVQGPRCPEEVMEAVTRLDRHPEVDVIIIARGGGSLEDLLGFSDEGVVRAVAACRTPVVSAIGHESDQPILDLVADLRASTPTGAAKQVVPDVTEEQERIVSARQQLRRAITQYVRREVEQLQALRSRPVLRDPTGGLAVHREQLTTTRERLRRAISQQVRTDRLEVDHAIAQIRMLSPRNTLQRGYAIVQDGSGDTITSVRQLDPGDDLEVQFADGSAVVEVRDLTASAHDPQDDHE